MNEKETIPVRAMSQDVRPPASPVASAPKKPVKRPRKRISQRNFMPILAVLTVFVVVLVIFLTLHRNTNSDTQLVKQVGKIMVLPSNEQPAISTVVNKDAAATQPFLAKSQNGDKVLLYYQAKLAILYRPSTNQVVATGPITQGPARVFVRNGSGSAQAAAQLVSEIKSDNVDYSVASQDVSPNPTYAQTIVVDLTGNRPDVAAKLAALLHAKVGSLPAGESRPDADMLVIVGKH